MKRSSKIVFTGVMLLFLLLGVALVVTKAVLNSTSVISKIEIAASDALDVDVRIDGRINLGFSPFLWLAANNITVNLAADKIASVNQVKIDPHLLDLWSSKIHLEHLAIHSPRLKFDSKALKKMLALKARKPAEFQAVESLAIDSFSISNAKFFYSDDRSRVELNEMNIGGGKVTVIENRKMMIDNVVSFMKAIQFRGDVSAGKFTSSAFNLENIKADLIGEKGLITFDPIELEYFGEHAVITGFLNLMENIHHLRILIDMPELDLGKFRTASGAKDIIAGEIQLRGEFEAHGAVIDELFRELNGNFSINGQNLKLKGIDIDIAIDDFKKLRATGFKDFAALVMPGPLGVMVLQGYDLLASLEKVMVPTGDSTIQTLVSHWKVFKGVIIAEDVAFSTQHNRIVLKGSLDMPNKTFINVIIALVDTDGCIVNSETVNGPFKNPEIKETGVLERTVIRPLKKIFKTECEVFYDGLVPHPK